MILIYWLIILVEKRDWWCYGVDTPPCSGVFGSYEICLLHTELRQSFGGKLCFFSSKYVFFYCYFETIFLCFCSCSLWWILLGVWLPRMLNISDIRILKWQPVEMVWSVQWTVVSRFEGWEWPEVQGYTLKTGPLSMSDPHIHWWMTGGSSRGWAQPWELRCQRSWDQGPWPLGLFIWRLGDLCKELWISRYE